MSAREAVAKAIFEATYPGWRWEQLEAVHLEEWGRVADAAIAALSARDESLPSAPCRECGPGYRIGDEGCRHDPYQPTTGETGICRTCAEPIWWETGTVGHQEREGWSDRIERGGDSLVCFKAVGYRHVPMGSREEAIYRAGFKAAGGTVG